MNINTQYDIDDLVEVMRQNTEYRECECCGNNTSIRFSETKEVARIKRIEISKEQIEYVVKFLKNNAGARYSYKEDDILNRVAKDKKRV